MPAPLDEQELLTAACELEGHPDNIAAALLGGLTVSCADSGRIARAARHLAGVAGHRGGDAGATPGNQSLARRAAGDRFRAPTPSSTCSASPFCWRRCAPSNFALLREALEDRLHQPYRAAIVPGLKEALELRHPSLLGVCLSGAGPSVVALAQQNLDEVSALLAEIYIRKSIPFHIQTLKVHPADSAPQSSLPARSWCLETAGGWKI